MCRNGYGEVGLQFFEDVGQGRWGRHAALHGETQTMCLLWPVVRVLAKNHHFGVIKRRVVERSKDIFVSRVDHMLLTLTCNERLQSVPVRLIKLGVKQWAPVGIHLPISATR